MHKHDILINGGGLAGITCVIALAQMDLDVGVIAPGFSPSNDNAAIAPPMGDRRTTALLSQSVTYLDELGIWEKVAPHASSLKIMRIIDATKRLIRAPQVDFRASEIDLESFGENVTNFDLLNVLHDCAKAYENVSLYDDFSSDIEIFDDHVFLQTKGGTKLKADFLIGADGRNSPVREAADIGTREWDYPQTALVTNFKHRLPHGNISTEFHTETGPFTIVPMPGNQSSLVWVETPKHAEVLAKLSTEELSVRIETQMHSVLGKVEIIGKVQTFPLSGMVSKQFGVGRVALIGEAAHVIPPIGAQGFNLGIRDIQGLANLLHSTSRAEWVNVGMHYHDSRLRDVNLRATSIDLLNRSLLSNFLPTQLLRGFGLSVLGIAGPLRRMIMREGVGLRS
ncbi:MAG: UbiH/UbiF family hydroxylase [Rhizobiaceae bacterium]|nr:UbiH/UbiF family hydroxylase [Rhizobiaceae bacterium]